MSIVFKNPSSYVCLTCLFGGGGGGDGGGCGRVCMKLGMGLWVQVNAGKSVCIGL